MTNTRRTIGAGPQRTLRSTIEQLEDRSVPSVVGTSFVDDNWAIINSVGPPGVLTNGDTVRNDNDTLNRGKIVGVFGTDAFSSINAAMPTR